MVKLSIVYIFVLFQSWISPNFSDESQELECIAYDDPLGKRYRGSVTVTRTGKLCQKWDSLEPNLSFYAPIFNNFPEFDDYKMSMGACRNPRPYWGPYGVDDDDKNDLEPDKPWCYLANGWGTEYCDIPKCNFTGEVVTRPSLSPTSAQWTPPLPKTRKRKSPSPLSTRNSRPYFDNKTEPEKMTDSTVTYRPTFSPTPAEPTTEVKGLEWWNNKATMGDFPKIFLMAYHVINLIMTAATNTFLVYIILTRINLLRRPCVIPLLVAGLFALINVGSNYGFIFGLTTEYNLFWRLKQDLCMFSNAFLEKVTILHVLLYSIVTMEATLAMRHPGTYDRASFLTFLTISVLTFTAVGYFVVTTYLYYVWIKLPDLLPGFISYFGETEAIYRYDQLVDNEHNQRSTSEFQQYWKRCSRRNIPDTWDYNVYIWSSMIPCFVGLGCMIMSLTMTYLPGRKKRNFIDAVSGKHNFTTSDLEELDKAAKSISLVTMICTIIPAVENAHTFAQTIFPSFQEATEQIFGMVTYFWWAEMLRRLFVLTSWVPALTSLFLNPVLAKARRGERDYRKFILEQHVETFFRRFTNRGVGNTSGMA